MSNEINALAKFFSYVSQKFEDVNEFVEEADANEDGTLTKGEFQNFIKDANINFTQDEITQVFKSLDTKTSGKISGTKLNNRNALDDSELDKMQDKLDAYKDIKDALDQVFSSDYEGLTIPAELVAYVSRASVEASVLANLNKNFQIKGDMADVLTVAIAKTGANGFGQECFNDALDYAKSAGKVPDSYAGDQDFQDLLSAYIKSLNAGTDLESIVSDVTNIVNAYFASAGIGQVSSDETGSNSTTFVWDDSKGLNALQLAVLSNTIITALSGDSEAYTKFKTEFDSALKNYIKDKCSEGDFSSIAEALQDPDAIVADFKDSKYGKALLVLLTYSDFSEPGQGTSQLNNAFYNALASALGPDFAKNLAAADVNYVAERGLYNTVLRTVYEMVLKGEIENDDTVIMNKMIELIITNYAEFKTGLGLGTSDGEVEGLYNNLQVLAGNNCALAAVRSAAIAYLDAVTNIGNEKLNNFVKATFGGVEYRAAINGIMAQSVIESMINKINNKYTEMVQAGEIVMQIEPSSCEVNNWNIGTVPVLIAGGDTKTLSCQADVKGPNGNSLTTSLTNPITYGIAAIGGSTGTTAEINADTGEITLTPGSQNGVVIIKVKVMIDGVEISTKEITINVKKSMSDVDFASGTRHEHLEVWNTEGLTDDTQVTSADFGKLYSGNAKICLHRECGVFRNTSDGWSANKELVKTRLNELGGFIVDALANSGYDKQILQQAKNNVVNKWINQAPKQSHVVTTRYRDGEYDTMCKDCCTQLIDKDADQSGIYNRGDEPVGFPAPGGSATYVMSNVYMISFKAFVDAIVAEYEKLGGN